MPAHTQERIDLPQGTLDLLILRTLALGPEHGWGISERIHQILSRSSANPAGFVVSRAASPRTPRLDQGPLGFVRQQSPREILRTHENRPQAARNRKGRVEEADRCRRSSLGPSLGSHHAQSLTSLSKLDSFLAKPCHPARPECFGEGRRSRLWPPGRTRRKQESASAFLMWSAGGRPARSNAGPVAHGPFPCQP